MEDNKQYYAFISYKREDEKWAKWLQDKLEHYKFPTNLNGRTDLPKAIRPTFRDVTDLKPGLLAEEINNALRNSQWLIVVCSPRSAKSPWVCKEAQTFIDLGRADHIIPFVIEGVPFSKDPESECYPEALLNLTGSNELLAANINEMGRDAAAIKVVARMFNLRFDALWQRYERETKRARNRKVGIIGVVVSLFALGVLLFALIVSNKNAELDEKNMQLETAADRLREDSVNLAKHIERIQNDSIILSIQKDSILTTNALLEVANNSLSKANLDLKEANTEILRSNWEIKVSNAKKMAERALEMVDNGYSAKARDIMVELCEDPEIYKLMSLPEMERALRTIYGLPNRNGIFSRFVLNDLGSISLTGFCDDGNSIFVVTKDTCVTKYNAKTGSYEGVVGTAPRSKKMDAYVCAWAYNDEKKTLIYSIDDTIYFFDIKNGKNIIHPIVTQHELTDVVVSPKFDKIAFECMTTMNRENEKPSNKSNFFIACIEDSSSKHFLIPNCNNIYTFSPDVNRLFVEIENLPCIYDIEKKDTTFSVRIDNYLQNVKWSNDGKRIYLHTFDKVVGRKLDYVKIYDLPSKQYLEISDSISGSFGRFQPSPACNMIVTGERDGLINVYTDVSSPLDPERIDYFNHHKLTLSGHNSHFNEISFDKTGKTLMTVSDESIILWDIALETVVDRILKPGYFYIASSGNSFIGKTSNDNFALANMRTKNMIGSPLFGGGDGFDIELISRNSEVVVATKGINNRITSPRDSILYVFNLRLSKMFKIPLSDKSFSPNFGYCCISKNGERLAFKNQGKLFVYNMIDGTKICEKNVDDFFHAFDISPDGHDIAISVKGEPIMMDAATLKITKKLANYDQIGYINGLAYSPDGQFIATVGADNSLRLWDAKRGKQIKRLYNSKVEYAGSCSISPDNKYIMAAGKLDTAQKEYTYIWNIETEEIAEIKESLRHFSKYRFCEDVPNKIIYEDKHYHIMDFPTLETIVKYFKEK